MKLPICALALAVVCISGCENKDTSKALDAEQFAYAMGGQRYLIRIPEDFDAQNDLLGFSLEFGDGSMESLGGLGDLSPGDEIVALCLPDGDHRWLFSIFSDNHRGRIPIGLPARFHPQVVSTFTSPSSTLSIGEAIVDFHSDQRAENGSFPNGEVIRLVLTINPRIKGSRQDAPPNGE